MRTFLEWLLSVWYLFVTSALAAAYVVLVYLPSRVWRWVGQMLLDDARKERDHAEK